MITPEEIAGSYRRAVNQSAQINILAELNACSREEIIRTLKEQGFKIKNNKKRKEESSRNAGNTRYDRENINKGKHCREHRGSSCSRHSGHDRKRHKGKRQRTSRKRTCSSTGHCKNRSKERDDRCTEKHRQHRGSDKSSKNNNERTGKISGKTHAEFKNIKTVPRITVAPVQQKEACMTKNILTQYEAARHEREDVKKRIQETERQLSRIENMHIVGDIVKGGSGGREKIKVEGFPDKEYSKKKTLLLQKNMRLWEIEKKLETLTDSVEQYIDSIEDSRKRNIMRYRYIDGMTWRETAKKLGPGNSEDAVRMEIKRFLKQT